ncbi:hypothetical protein CW751_10405 [Brumimicrobium salinarum]|uniref:START-like domain-containing protein n=1 Tax=Brumimicrobium salinarum TaxID=2058658 RepID=A0A2I0R114_9FLAO|nr:START-like domain-containing protein [Brumimicrobium salinarum]PKR80259.1 hypothetical protein CW751_10405 [Brumimicrobium salinarum]
MPEKIKFEQEYLFKTSMKVLNSMVTTPSGLSEWFADDVNIKDDLYTFYWNGSEEEARLISKKNNDHFKFQWIEDEEEDLETFVELKFKVDPMTKAVVLHLTSFAEPDELDEIQLYWESTIEELRRIIGA